MTKPMMKPKSLGEHDDRDVQHDVAELAQCARIIVSFLRSTIHPGPAADDLERVVLRRLAQIGKV